MKDNLRNPSESFLDMGKQGFAKGISRRTINFTIYGLLFLSAFVPFVTVWAHLGGRALPWWSDGGNWLKHMYAVLGETRPLWNEGTYQYPPLYFLLLAAAYLPLQSEILALKLTAVSIFSLRPITTYILAKRLFNRRFPALVAAWLASVPPFAVEMLGWGGYPNLLGLAILPFAFYSILNLTEKTSFRNIVATLVLALTITLTHHLTFLVFVGTMVLWVSALGLMKVRREFTAVGSTLLFTLAVFTAYRLIFAWPTQFILINEAAYHHLTLAANPGTIMWIFKDRLLLFLLFLTAFLSMVLSMEEEFERVKMRLLVAWVVVPILMSQSHLLGVTMDYPRVFIFAVQPLLMLATMPLSFLSKVVGCSSSLMHALKRDVSVFLNGVKQGKLGGVERISGKRLLVFVLVIITLAAASMNLSIGLQTVGSVESWYRGIDYYGDEEKLNATKWIKNRTTPEDVFVAEEQIGRWIEGLARRPALLYQQPEFLFMVGEAERAYAARSILTSNYGIVNGFIWVFDQAPHGVFSPIISFYHKGDYESLLYLDVNSTQVEWVSNDGKVWREPLLNATRVEVEWVVRSWELTTLLVRFFMKDLTVERWVTVEEAKPYVRFSFKVIPLREDVEMHRLEVRLNRMDGRDFWEIWLPDKVVRLLTDIGWVNIRSTAHSISSDKERMWIAFMFSEDKHGGTSDYEIMVQVDDPEGRALTVESYERKEVMVKYGVKYIVLPKNSRREWGMQFAPKTETFPIYSHLLKNEALFIAYENERMIILKTRNPLTR